jgi:recombination protein RecA
LQPDTAEDALSIAIDSVKAGCKVVILDSYAAMTTEAEMAGDIGDAHVALTPRMIGQFCRKAAGIFYDHGALFIAINQIREKIGVVYGSPEVTPGGRAPKYFSSVRLRTTSKPYPNYQNQTGMTITVRSIKNKVAPQHQEAEYRILYDKGIDYVGALVPGAVEAGLLIKSGSWYSDPETGEKIGQGEASVVEWFEANPDQYNRIKESLDA